MLSIPRVRDTDNGEYCCIASNGIGEAAKSCGALQLKMSMSVFFFKILYIHIPITVALKHKAKCILSVFPTEPQIKRHPTNVTLLVESKAVLPCVTLGNPKPDVTWLKDDELIKVCHPFLNILYIKDSDIPHLGLVYSVPQYYI